MITIYFPSTWSFTDLTVWMTRRYPTSDGFRWFGEYQRGTGVTTGINWTHIYIL